MKSIGPVIDKTEAFIISEIFNKNDSSLVYIGKDDREIINIKKKLSWLHPNLRVLLYKAWDHIPYDNISPSKEIQTSRLETLFYLSSIKETKIIILTTLNGIMQKTVPKNEINKNFITISKKNKFQIDKILFLLIKLGYERTSIVRDKSEFAVRGSIIDIFLPQFDKPIRIDLFDEDIDSIFEFDPISQKRVKESNLESFTLNPSSELIIDNENLEKFRAEFRSLFQNYRKSQTYELFSSGLVPSGGEQFLPLFYKNLETLFDYCENSQLIIHNDIIELFDERIENLNDYYEARSNSNESFFLKPQYLFIDKDYFDQILDKFKVTKLSFFKNEGDIAANLKKINNISSIREKIDFNFIKKFFDINSANKKIIVCCNTKGSLEKVYRILNENIFISPFEIKNLSNLSNQKTYITVLEIEESFEINNIIYINEKTIFGYSLAVKSIKKDQKKKFLFEELNKLSQGSLLVHSEYGVCRFNNIKKIDLNDSIHDCLELEFADNQKLFLPVEHLNYITKYGNEDENTINLDRLGASSWQKRKAEAKKKI